MKKKIFFIDRYISYSTNLFTHLEEISKANNFELSFLGPKKENIEKFSTNVLPNAKMIWSADNYNKEILDYIKKEKPDLAHFSFELKTYGTIGSLWKFPYLLFLLKNRTKLVLTLHNILVFKNNGKWDVHSYFLKNIPKFIIKFFLKIFFKIICGISDKIIVGTFIGKKALIEFYGIDEKKIEVIQLGVSEKNEINTQKQDKFKKLFLNKKIILCFGVISPRKGQDVIINAFKKIEQSLPNHILVIAGKAPKEFHSYEKQIQTVSGTLQNDNRIYFTGLIDDDEIDALFNLSEVGLYLYRPMSSSTYALTYAIQYEKPVIATKLDTFFEILDKDYPLLVEYDDVQSLANSIQTLCNDEEMQLNLSKKMKLLKNQFSWENSAKKNLEVYKELL